MAEPTNTGAVTPQALATYVQTDYASETAYLTQCVEEAEEMISDHTTGATVPPKTRRRAVMEVSADLYYRRKTRNGVADFDGMENAAPVRVARDPMTAAYPILRPYVGPGIA